MGCDIHFYVERKVGDVWVSPERWVKEYDDENDYPANVSYKEELYGDRNYRLFSILADVRNGYGFAGVPTGAGFAPISEPKGLPEDCDYRIRERSDYEGVDGHSHSYFTLNELINYDWTQTAVLYGVISAPQFVEWNEWRRGAGLGPESWCGDVGGGGVIKVPLDEMERLVQQVRSRFDKPREFGWWDEFKDAVCNELRNVYTRIEWSVPYYLAAGTFWSEAMPKLFRVMSREGLTPDDVRIVFWFDN